MKQYLLAAVAATVLFCSNAHAEAFNGAYAGAVVGYDKLSLKASSGGISTKVSGDGVAGGLMFGYNAKVSNAFVIGAEIEGVIGGGKVSDGIDTVNTDYSANASLRAGFLAGEKALIYGKVGYGRTRVKADGESDSGGGFAFGGGIEAALSDKVSARIAYTRTNYSISDDLQAVAGADIDLNRDQVMAGVAFHF